MTNVHDVKVRLQKFGWPDYMVFVLMLLSCACIGVYFALKMRHEAKRRKGENNKDAEDSYLVGGRNMKMFPISMSLISSFISGITLLGTPTEIYLYGIQYIYVVGALVLMGFAMYYVYLPVFHDLKLTSTYQYLETRFDRRMRLFGSILFTCGSLMWLPIVIYVPALAFNQATGINIHWVTPVVCLVCIFYTCVGGLQAVVWTDVVQAILMFGAMILIIVKGTMDIGGPGVVWERAWNSGRIESPNWTFDLRERHTVYSLLLGGFPHWLKSNAVSQNMIQRYLSLPTLRIARQALWVFVLGVFLLLAICCYSGLLIYATYSDCDPLTTKLATRKDQLLPLLVMETLGDFPGLPGLFVAGVFSAALSSLSTGLNSMSAVVLEDFFKSFCKKPLTERQTAFIMRGVVVVFGALCVALVFVVEKLGTVLQLSMSLAAVSNGPLLGIFTMAVLVPWVEGRGAIIGGTTGLAIMSWIVAKAQAAIATGELSFITKPLTTSGCSYTFFAQSSMSMLALNETTEQTTAMPPADESFKIYHISYLYYTMLGAVITITVGLMCSLLIGPNKPNEVDPKLLAPFVRRMIGGTKTKRKSKKRLEPIGEDNLAFAEGLKFNRSADGDIIAKNTKSWEEALEKEKQAELLSSDENDFDESAKFPDSVISELNTLMSEIISDKHYTPTPTRYEPTCSTVIIDDSQQRATLQSISSKLEELKNEHAEQKKLLEQFIAKTEVTLNLIVEKVCVMGMGREVPENNLPDNLLPISNQQQMDELEEKIEADPVFKRCLVRKLSTFGGVNAAKTIRTICKCMFADQLLTDYSYFGTGSKKKFNKYKSIFAVVLEAVRERYAM